MDSKTIAKIAQIASALEVSGYPKPGNVHRTRDFEDMEFEDFIISGIVIGEAIEEATSRVDKNNLQNARLGKYILEAVKETDKWVANNTNLGIMMMITPIACGAAISDDFSQVRQNMFELMKSTTVEDAVDLYDAINIADAGGMGDQDEYNVTTETAKDKLRANNQTMFDVLEISAPKDRLGNELTTGMGVVFELGYPTYDNLRKTTTSNKACVLTFLTILSEVPDTLISRKYGDDKASEVSLQAKQLLKFSDEDIFEDKLTEFDDYLYENKLNPGTTADLVAASIFVRYLKSNF